MEILQEAFAPINLGLTILLGLVLAYWLMVILGGLHLHHDIGGGAGHDVGHIGGHDIGHAGGHDLAHCGHDMAHGGAHDVAHGGAHGVAHGGHDVSGHDAGHDAHSDAGFWAGVLSFFHVGQMPLMMIISIMVLSMWTFSLLANHYINPAHAALLGMGLLAANFILSLMVLKVTGAPVARVFLALDRDVNAPAEVIGQVCRVLSCADTARLGQAEVPNDKGSPLLLNIRTLSGKSVRAGDKAIVVDRDPQTGVYLVTPSELES